jgi:hypothetical protein
MIKAINKCYKWWAPLGLGLKLKSIGTCKPWLKWLGWKGRRLRPKGRT